MAIKITKRSIFGGGTIFESLSAETIALAIKEMGEKPNLTSANLTSANLTSANLTSANLTSANLTSANLTRANLTSANLTSANLTSANLTSANLTSAVISWQSHDCISELLRRDAGEDTQKRMVAGLILVSRDWCWDKFLSLELAPELRDWALITLSAWAWAGDRNVPILLTEWMERKGIERPVRPEVETKTESEGKP